MMTMTIDTTYSILSCDLIPCTHLCEDTDPGYRNLPAPPPAPKVDCDNGMLTGRASVEAEACASSLLWRDEDQGMLKRLCREGRKVLKREEDEHAVSPCDQEQLPEACCALDSRHAAQFWRVGITSSA